MSSLHDIIYFTWALCYVTRNEQQVSRLSKEYRAFSQLLDRILTVPKQAVDERVAAYKAERDAMPRRLRPGRRPRNFRPPPRHNE